MNVEKITSLKHSLEANELDQLEILVDTQNNLG